MAGSASGAVTGFLAKDPQQKANGKAAELTIPVSKGREGATTWWRITAWGKDAEFAMQYLRKGSLVTASGEIELREYEGAKGKGFSLEMNAHRVVSHKTDTGGARANEPQGDGYAQPQGGRGVPAEDEIPF